MYAIKMLGEEKLDSGVEILKITNLPFAEIYKTIYKTTCADGLNSSFISSYISNNFFETYALNFGLPKKFLIAYKDSKDNGIHELTCSPVGIGRIMKYNRSKANHCDSLCST